MAALIQRARFGEGHRALVALGYAPARGVVTTIIPAEGAFETPLVTGSASHATSARGEARTIDWAALRRSTWVTWFAAVPAVGAGARPAAGALFDFLPTFARLRRPSR
jgi:hypothetical protein